MIDGDVARPGSVLHPPRSGMELGGTTHWLAARCQGAAIFWSARQALRVAGALPMGRSRLAWRAGSLSMKESNASGRTEMDRRWCSQRLCRAAFGPLGM